MFETTHRGTTKSSALIAFEPRQVTLAKQREMKNKKVHSEMLENDSSDQKVTIKSSRKEKSKKKSSRDSTPLLLSIAAYLEHNGFSKTLTALRSEALIDELDGSKGHPLDLEMYFKYLEASKYGAKANLNDSQELDSQKDGTAEKVKEESKYAASVESISKKKGKKCKGSDADTVNEQHGIGNGFSKCANDSDGKLTNEVVPMLVVKSKEKKKRSKVASDSLDESAQEVGSEIFRDPAESTVCELQLGESDKKSKDKRKKKSKLISAENVVQGDPEALPQAIKEKTRDSESSPSAVSIEKKGSKKRKSLASEENESQPDGKIASKEAKRSEIEDSVVEKGKDRLPKEKPLLENGHTGKKRKTENGQDDSNKSPEIFLGKQLDGLTEVKEATKECFGKNKASNGNLDKNGREGSATQKSTKKQFNGSAEPKTVNAFQRVKIDEVEFVDERLQDNSYWAKDGADIGYGAKAQEVLGQVRGRDFRHEKTKKKRGSYRGGQIDLQSHSIKFNYSDEE